MDSIADSWANISIAKKVHPIRFHNNAKAAITQYQRGTDDFVSSFIFVFLRFQTATSADVLVDEDWVSVRIDEH